MKNKILIELIVPDITETYNIYIPINRKIGNLIELLNKSISELTDNNYIGSEKTNLYNRITGEKYHFNSLIRETDIRNGSSLILM